MPGGRGGTLTGVVEPEPTVDAERPVADDPRVATVPSDDDTRRLEDDLAMAEAAMAHVESGDLDAAEAALDRLRSVASPSEVSAPIAPSAPPTVPHDPTD